MLCTSKMFRAAGAVAAIQLLATAAHAHHPTDGMMPTTFWHGLLSGIGHPVIGPDHLAFVVGIGLLAAIAGYGLLLPVLFVVAMLAGLQMHILGVNLPYTEVLLAGSVVLVGVAVWRRRAARGPRLEGGLLALVGLLHGYAFAETIIGAETGPLSAYVIGLALTQLAIASLAYLVARPMPQGEPMLAKARVRALGLGIAAIGAVLLVAGVSAVA